MDIDCNFGEPLINYACDSWEDILIDSDANILDGLYLLHISTFRHYVDRTLNECHQLILMPITTDGQFGRVGLAIANVDGFEEAAQWEMREVTIV
jgi:hypothetical protein